MNLIKEYIQNFINRAGSYIFFATVISRGLSFVASLAVLLFISNKELGVVISAFSIVSLLIPITGFGLHQSLIRYGALLKTQIEKDSLFIYVLKKGTIASFVIVAIILTASFSFSFEFEKKGTYLALFSLMMLSMFFFEIIRAQFRLNHDNKSFAFTEIIHSVIFLLNVCLLSYLFKEEGYIIAFIISPLITSLFLISRLKINYKRQQQLSIINFSFWKYGFFASLSNVATQFLLIVDLLLIEYVLKDPVMITNYRYISLIPFSLLFLPRIFINTDFVSFTENIFNKKYIKNYIKSYTLLFVCISCLILTICVVCSEDILNLIAPEFGKHQNVFLILIIGVCGIFILRGLYGNLLSSIGKASVNYYIALISLLINVLANLYLIPAYGILGAAITTACLMWFSGIVSLSCFWYYYKKELTLKQSY